MELNRFCLDIAALSAYLFTFYVGLRLRKVLFKALLRRFSNPKKQVLSPMLGPYRSIGVESRESSRRKRFRSLRYLPQALVFGVAFGLNCGFGSFGFETYDAPWSRVAFAGLMALLTTGMFVSFSGGSRVAT